MKVLCMADLHCGAGAAYADDRLADQAKVLAQVVEIIRADEGIDLVLLAGDIMHRPRPTPSTLLMFKTFVDELAEMEVPTVACTGNSSHDIENADRPCALDLFESRWFRVSRRPELIWDFVDGVNVATLPSVPVSRLVSQADSVERGPIFDQAAEALLAIATELREAHGAVARVNAEDVGKHIPTILMGHWACSGASLPNGLPVDSLNEPILDLASLERLNYDAMVFGHLHKAQVLSDKPVWYCGSPMTVDFGEEGQDHGVWILDTDELAIADHALKFVPLKDRPFVTVGVSIDDMHGWTLDSDEDVTDAVVRVRYTATEEQNRRIDTSALKRSLLDAGAHRVYQISAEIVKADRARVQGVDENLEPAAALDAWIDANDVVDGDGLRELLSRYTGEVAE